MSRIQSTSNSFGSRFPAQPVHGAGEGGVDKPATLFEEFSLALKQVVRHLRENHPELEVVPQTAPTNDRPVAFSSPAPESRTPPTRVESKQDGDAPDNLPSSLTSEGDTESPTADGSNDISSSEEIAEMATEASALGDTTQSSEAAGQLAAAPSQRKLEVVIEKGELGAEETEYSDLPGSGDDAVDMTMFAALDEAQAEELVATVNEGRIPEPESDLIATSDEVKSDDFVAQSANEVELLKGSLEEVPVVVQENSVPAPPDNHLRDGVKAVEVKSGGTLPEPSMEQQDPALEPEMTVPSPSHASAPEASPQVTEPSVKANEPRAQVRSEASLLLNEISRALASVMGDRSGAAARVVVDTGQVARSVENLASINRVQGAASSGQLGGFGVQERGQSAEGLARSQRVVARAAIARAIERVEDALKEAVRAKDGKSISLRLDPPELGTVKIDLSLREGGLHARLVSESSQVSAVLRDRAGDLHFLLRKSGIEVDQITVIIRTAGDEDSISFDTQYRGRGSDEWQFQGQEGEGGRSQSHLKSDAEGSSGTLYERSNEVIDHWIA